MALVIGLTGGMGVGKSTVAGLLATRDATVIDVDAVGRSVLEPGGGAFDGVVEAFGSGIVGDDGLIDRAALAAAVFGGDGRLAELEAISHPAINAVLADAVAEASSTVVLDMAVLTESRLGWIEGERLYQRVVVVEAPLDLRIERLAGRGVAADDARARIAAQASDHDRRMLADVVLTNDGGLEQLRAEVERLAPTIEAWEVQHA